MMTNFKKCSALSTSISVVISALAFSSGPASASTAGDNVLTLLGCDGRYAQIDARRSSTIASGLYGRYTTPQTKFDGCLIGDVIGSTNNVLLAVMPENLTVDEDGARNYAVTALNAVDLKIQHSYSLPTKQGIEPRLLYDSLRHDTLVSYNDSHSIQRLQLTAGGEFLLSGPAVASQTPFATSSLRPYVDEQGNIVDGDRLLSSEGAVLSHLDSESILDATLKAKFAGLTQIKGSREHSYTAMEQASAANRVVYTVGWDSQSTRVPQSGVIVYDINAGRVLTSFFSKFPVAAGYYPDRSIHIAPDGNKIVIEQYQWLSDQNAASSDSPPRQSRFRTGVLAIYDANTGMLTGEVSLDKNPPAKSIGRKINFSADGKHLYYLFNGKFYVIDLESKSASLGITMPPNFEPIAVVP